MTPPRPAGIAGSLRYDRSVEDFSTGWRALLCFEPGTRVLEISRDRGERAGALTQDGAVVVCLRSSLAEVEELRVLGHEAILAFSGEDGGRGDKFDAVVLAVAPGGGHRRAWNRGEVAGLLGQALELLDQGGSLLVSVSNPLFSLPGLASLPAWSRSEPRRQGLSPRVGRYQPLGVRKLRRLITEAGFSGVRVFAALPGARRPKFLVPLEEPAIADYFFEFMAPRPASARRRALLAVARWSARLRLFDRFAPAYEISASKGVAS